MRLIDADALLEEIDKIAANHMILSYVKGKITNAPTIQREAQDKLTGWKLVPLEPTDEMKRALFKNLIHADDEAYVIKAILAAAPTQSLIDFENSVIEKCAKVCEDINKYTQFQTIEDYKLANEAARNIRALKQEVK